MSRPKCRGNGTFNIRGARPRDRGPHAEQGRHDPQRRTLRASERPSDAGGGRGGVALRAWPSGDTPTAALRPLRPPCTPRLSTSDRTVRRATFQGGLLRAVPILGPCYGCSRWQRGHAMAAIGRLLRQSGTALHQGSDGQSWRLRRDRERARRARSPEFHL